MELFELLDPLFCGDDPEVGSAAVQALAVCVNRLLEDVPSGQICPVLRKVLFIEGTSWQESIDILAVIREIDVRLFIGRFGEAALMEMIETLIGFCFGSNEDLSKESLALLLRFVSERNAEVVVTRFADSTNFFDFEDLIKSLAAITAILQKMAKLALSLYLFAQRPIEMFWYFLDDLNVLSVIFGFFTVYQTHPLKLSTLGCVARHIISISIETLSGKQPRWGICLSDEFIEVIQEDVSNRDPDVVMSSADDYFAFLDPMRRPL
jgi:hypothetical protein